MSTCYLSGSVFGIDNLVSQVNKQKTTKLIKYIKFYDKGKQRMLPEHAGRKQTQHEKCRLSVRLLVEAVSEREVGHARKRSAETASQHGAGTLRRGLLWGRASRKVGWGQTVNGGPLWYAKEHVCSWKSLGETWRHLKQEPNILVLISF